MLANVLATAKLQPSIFPVRITFTVLVGPSLDFQCIFLRFGTREREPGMSNREICDKGEAERSRSACRSEHAGIPVWGCLSHACSTFLRHCKAIAKPWKDDCNMSSASVTIIRNDYQRVQESQNSIEEVTGLSFPMGQVRGCLPRQETMLLVFTLVIYFTVCSYPQVCHALSPSRR